MRRRKSEPKADIASRKASKNRDFGSAYLEGTESSLSDLDAEGSERFSEAWNDGEDTGESLDAAINVDSTSSTARRHRSLEQQRRLMFVGLGAAILVVAVLAFALTRVITADDAGVSAPDFNDGPTALVSPLAARSYTAAVGLVEVATVAAVDQYFIDSDDTGELAPLDAEEAATLGIADTSVLHGPVFWAGRAHVAVVSDEDLFTGGRCVITTLASAELRAIDVASAGECDEAFGQLGDRTACRGTNVVLLEVWPFNPDSVVEPEAVASIRTRVEQDIDGQIVSRRSTLLLEGGENSIAATSVIDAASTLNGAPGDDVTLSIDGVEGTCTLLDRDVVEVRLLPG